MLATRVEAYERDNTSRYLSSYLGLLNSDSVKRVTLFATEREFGNYVDSNHDYSPSTLPVVVALAEVSQPSLPTLYVVFDGMFLTAMLTSRYSEVRQMLDASIASGKVYFSADRVPFTAAMEPEDAAALLSNVSNPVLLNEESRPSYFSLLTIVPESEY